MISNGTILRAVASFQTPNGTIMQNTYFLRCNFAADQGDIAVATAVDDYLAIPYEDIEPDIKASVVPYQLTVDVVEFSQGAWRQVRQLWQGGWGSGLDFTGATSSLPEGVAAVVNFKTNQGKHQGRKFIGGLAEGAADALGNMENFVLTRFLSAFGQMLAPYVVTAGNELEYVIVSTAENVVREITSLVITRIFGYQRRRKPGRGS